MPFSFSLPRLTALRRFKLPFHLPILTAAEKTALLALTLTLACGGALRLWERSGVHIGPVHDWETLRALIVRSRDTQKSQGIDVGAYPCLDDASAAGFWDRKGGGGASGQAVLLAAGAASAKPKAGSAGKKPPGRPVDLNAAGERALLALPGVGPSTAKAIVAHRAASGRFKAVDDLLQVKGIGPKKLEALRPYVRVEVPVAPSPTPPETPAAAP